MFNFFKKKEEPENMEEVLNFLRKLKKDNEELRSEIKKIKEESFSFIKKVEVIRYNPFSQIGGDQSFSAIFLNKNNNGLIITGLYNESGSRVYSKSVEKGISKYSLSEEESKLLKRIIEN